MRKGMYRVNISLYIHLYKYILFLIYLAEFQLMNNAGLPTTLSIDKVPPYWQQKRSHYTNSAMARKLAPAAEKKNDRYNNDFSRK